MWIRKLMPSHSQKTTGVLTAILLLLTVLSGCLTTGGGIPINPVYATRTPRNITGEISFGTVEQPSNKYGDTNSMGAVNLPVSVADFCSDALRKELVNHGFSLIEKAPLKVNAIVRQADTIWQKQGQGGVYNSTLALEFYLTDSAGNEVYRQIHQGNAAHSQAYGGYPASASVVDALGTAYERFLKDPRLQEVLVATKSINLYGQAAVKAEERISYKDEIFRDYSKALEAVSPDLIDYMSGDKFDEAYAILGFKNREGERNQLSVEIERELRGILSRERFQVVTRELDEIIEEQKMQLSGLFDEDTMVEIGMLIGASQMISGSLYHYPDEGIIAMRIEVVAVETGLVGASFSTNLLASRSYVEMVGQAP